MNNLNKYNEIFTNVLNLKQEQLNAECTVNNIASWDSMSHLSLVTALEESFDIMFDPEDIIEFATYEGGKDILKKYEVQI